MKFPAIIIILSMSFSVLCQSDFGMGISKDEKQKIEQYYSANNGIVNTSKSTGTVSNGGLAFGKLIPFFGDNYTYFDQQSYLAGRAFTSDAVKQVILDSYLVLQERRPNYHFRVMELSNKLGGKMTPHITHQNGMSVDFMMPKLMNNKPYVGLDNLGINHYWLAFNDQGQYKKDTSISVDFNLIAQHILILQEQAGKQGMKISKVIKKVEYKDKLFDTFFGKKLKESGIYIVKNLSDFINALHDDHYHIDFIEI